MARKIAILAAIGAAISLGGCSVIDEGLWPVVMGEDPEPVRITRTQEALPAASPARPAEEIRSEEPVTVTGGQTREVDALPGAPEVVPLRTMQSQAGPV